MHPAEASHPSLLVAIRALWAARAGQFCRPSSKKQAPQNALKGQAHASPGQSESASAALGSAATKNTRALKGQFIDDQS